MSTNQINENIIKLNGGVSQVEGVKASGVRKGKYGLALIYAPNSTASAVYTSNTIVAAPLSYTREVLKDGKLSLIIANSGNANCFTGQQGILDCKTTVEEASQLLQLAPNQITTASTGVIGRQMPMEIIIPEIHEAVKKLDNTPEASNNAAKAIMTTDTFEKEYAVEVTLENGKKVHIGGICKGVGMIAPNMATMLGFITTDAIVDRKHLQEALNNAVNKSFNMVIVDGDESTNDTAILLATGKTKNSVIRYDGTIDKNFQEALNTVCVELAKMMARDGEGASKFIQVQVDSANNEEDAIKAAKSVVGSSLVKSAMFGGDPNWGRIVAAVGYADIKMDPNNITISIASDNDKVDLVKNGEILAFDGTVYLQKAEKIVQEENIYILIELFQGEGSATAYGCDLTYDYVKINAEYTT
jgi:glutamate N-acetyltransferase/amino-acid N-acetyltransferase